MLRSIRAIARRSSHHGCRHPLPVSVPVHADSQGRRPRRGDDGLPDRRAHRQRGLAGGAAGHHPARHGRRCAARRAEQVRPRRDGWPEEVQTRRVLRSRQRSPYRHRKLRRRPRAHQGLRLDHRGRRREPRHQARSARQSGAAPPRRFDPYLKHLRNPHRQHRGNALGRGTAPLLRHALLQSAALHAAAGDHSHA